MLIYIEISLFDSPAQTSKISPAIGCIDNS